MWFMQKSQRELVDEIFGELQEFHRKLKVPLRPGGFLNGLAAKHLPRLMHGPGKPGRLFPKKTVVVYCFQHATSKLLPVIRELEKEGWGVVALAMDYSSRTILLRNGIPCRHLDEYLTAGIREEIKGAGYVGVKGNIFRAVRLSEAMLRKERPALVLSNIDSWLAGKTLAKVADRMGIPTLLYQHGFVPEQDLPFASRYIAVWGDYYKRRLKKLGVPAGRIFTVGFNGADMILKGGFRSRKDVCRSLRLDPEKRIITLTSQGHAPWLDKKKDEMFLRAVFGGMKRLGDAQIVVKLHPAEDGRVAREVARKTGCRVRFTRDFGLYDLLAASDAMVTISSTTAVEAMVLGKPVIICDFFGRPESREYVKSGAVIAAKRPGGFGKVLEKLEDRALLRKMEKRKGKFLLDRVYKTDGNANRRLVSLIRKLGKNG